MVIQFLCKLLCCVGSSELGGAWVIGQIVMGDQMGVGDYVVFLLSQNLHEWNPFWRVLLHCVGMGLMETIRVYMMCEAWYA